MLKLTRIKEKKKVNKGAITSQAIENVVRVCIAWYKH